MKNKLEVTLPQNFNIVVWKKSKLLNNKKNLFNIFIYNKNKKIKLFYYDNNFKFENSTNTLIMEHNYANYLNKKISNFFFNFIKSWDFYFYQKIKFKGKGFRIRYLKKNKLVKFFFGRSHKTFIFFKNIYMKKINKYKFILKSIYKQKLNLNSKLITNIKPMNLFTLRGLRSSKQIVYKRKGKKGTYI